VKKSQDRRAMPCIAMSTKSTAKVSTPTMSAARPQAMNAVSQRRRRRIRRRGSVALTEMPAEEMAGDVAPEREEHQREAGGKDGLVAEGAVRQVAERDLHDIGGDGRRGLERVERQVGLHAGGHRDDHGLAHRARDAEDIS